MKDEVKVYKFSDVFMSDCRLHEIQDAEVVLKSDHDRIVAEKDAQIAALSKKISTAARIQETAKYNVLYRKEKEHSAVLEARLIKAVEQRDRAIYNQQACLGAYDNREISRKFNNELDLITAESLKRGE